MFARSRVSWNLPGGLILSALVAETYRLDRTRDDRSLYDTLQSFVARLAKSLVVLNPVERSLELTGSPRILSQMKELTVRLDDALGALSVVAERRCSRKKALRAWGKFFNTVSGLRRQ